MAFSFTLPFHAVASAGDGVAESKWAVLPDAARHSRVTQDGFRHVVLGGLCGGQGGEPPAVSRHHSAEGGRPLPRSAQSLPWAGHSHRKAAAALLGTPDSHFLTAVVPAVQALGPGS